MDRPRYASFWTDPLAIPENEDERERLSAARSMLVARRALATELPAELLHDPTLTMLLSLFIRPVHAAPSVQDLALVAGMADAIAKRWMAVLVDRDYIAIRSEGAAVLLTEHGRTIVTRAVRAVIASQQDLHLSDLH